MDELIVGDRNEVRIFTGMCHRDVFHRRDSLITVERETAKHLIEKGEAELIAVEFDKPLRMHGRPIDFRK